MLAVLKTGGKQYAVQEQDRILVERIAGDVGASVALREVLLVKDGAQVTLGTPVINGALVEAEITAQPRATKIMVVKFRRRKHYRNRWGIGRTSRSLRFGPSAVRRKCMANGALKHDGT